MSKVTGRVFINVAGFGKLRSRPGATINFGGVTRSAVVSDAGVDGYNETIIAPQVSCSISHVAGLDVIALNNIVDDTLQFETDTGVTYKLQECWLSEPAELNGESGEISLTFMGKQVNPA